MNLGCWLLAFGRWLLAVINVYRLPITVYRYWPLTPNTTPYTLNSKL